MVAVQTRVAVVPARAALVAWSGALAVLAMAAWLALVGTRDLGSGQQIWQTISTARGVDVGPVVVVFVALLFAAEQIWPAVRRPLWCRAYLVDAFYLVLFAVAVIPVLVLVQVGFMVEIDRHLPFLVLGRLPVVPRALVVVVILVCMDGINWAAHVANHRFRALWRLHALHHSQEDMSVLTTFRTHPLMHAAYVPSVLPALVLGASGSVPASALIVYACLTALPHANLNWSFGPLSRLIVSPAYHRLHHARRLGKRGNVNFGFVLVVWDRLAGKAAFPKDAEPVSTGISRRPVPIEQTASWGGTASVVLAQLAGPFRRNAATDGPL